MQMINKVAVLVLILNLISHSSAFFTDPYMNKFLEKQRSLKFMNAVSVLLTDVSDAL